MIETDLQQKSERRRRAPSQELSAAPALTVAPAPDVEHLIRPLAQRAMFMRPEHLCKSAWLEHIPFAFWLVEAHRPRVLVELGTDSGASYFAFCQAVDRLGLDTRCFAVDTWKGDQHSGFYGEDTFESVSARNEAHYAHFSRLVRSTFDEALEHFSDGTIDLLHIDGLHLLEAVRHDFESWLPKLSERAVVIFHDSNVRERQFGVFRMVEELKGRYPSFEFTYGHGLAVFGVGPEQTDLVSRLFETGEDGFARRMLHDIFGRLGRACVDAHAAEHRQAQLRDLRADIARREGEVARTREALEAARDDLGRRTKELSDTRAKLKEETERCSREREALSKELEAERVARQNAEKEAAGHRSDSGARAAEIAKLTELLCEAETSGAVVREKLSQVEALREAETFRAGMMHEKLSQVEALCEAETSRAGVMRETLSHLVGTAVRAAGGYSADVPPKGRALRKLSERLRAAGVVDADWYLARNEDVASAGLDAAAHYVLFGYQEGREPRDLSTWRRS